MIELAVFILTIQTGFMAGAVAVWVRVEHRLTEIETFLGCGKIGIKK